MCLKANGEGVIFDIQCAEVSTQTETVWACNTASYVLILLHSLQPMSAGVANHLPSAFFLAFGLTGCVIGGKGKGNSLSKMCLHYIVAFNDFFFSHSCLMTKIHCDICRQYLFDNNLVFPVNFNAKGELFRLLIISTKFHLLKEKLICKITRTH